jgi:hypothetical protein
LSENEQPIGEALDGVPAVYRLPASKKSLKQNQFEFQLVEDGPIYSIPKLKFVKPSLAVQIEDLPLQVAVVRLFDEFHPGLFESFEDADQLEGFTRAWATASGINIPESKPSSDSSDNTEGLPNTSSSNEGTTSTN